MNQEHYFKLLIFPVYKFIFHHKMSFITYIIKKYIKKV